MALSIFAGWRCNNADWINYVGIFENVIKYGLSEGSADIGFNILVKALSLISTSNVFIFTVISFVAVSLNIISFGRYTPFLFTAILLYFVHGFVLKEMIQIRVGLASAICTYSIYYLCKNNLKVFFALWLIALSIHFSSVIFILAYFGSKFLNKKTLLYCVLISLLIGSVYPLGSVVKSATGLDERLDSYIAYGDEVYAQSLGIWSNLNTVKCLIVFCGLYYYFDRLAKDNKYFETLFKCYVIGLCWLICFNDFAIIGARMSNILLACEPILLTIPYSLLKRSSRWAYSLVIIILAILIFRANIAPNKVIPYSFYFS